MTIEFSLDFLVISLAFFTALTSFEYLSLLPYSRGTHIFGWKIGRQSANELTLLIRPRHLDFLMSDKRIFLMLIARCFFSLSLIFYRSPLWETLSLVFIFLSALILLFRNSFGKDGSDQLAIAVSAALVPMSIFPSSDVILLSSVGFIFIQVCMAYVTSGVAKLASPIWVSGDALRTIMATRLYGTSWAHLLLEKHRMLGVALTMPLLVWQISFPILLLLNKSTMLVALAVGVVFHITIAGIMGVNRFPVIFIGTYPLLAYSATIIREYVAAF